LADSSRLVTGAGMTAALPHLHALAGDGDGLAALERRVRALEHVVGQLSRQRAGAIDGRLGEVLRLIHAFAASTPWTAGELLQDAARADRSLWFALDAITGGRGDPCKRLGRFLEKHAGSEVGGFRLVRVKREAGSWLYSIEVAGELEVISA
jgi:hypothetical protein